MYKKGSKGWLKHFDFILLDMICLQIAFLLAYVIRHDSGSPYIVPLYRNMAIFMELLDIVVMFFYETLSNVLKRGYFREFAATVKHVLLVELFSVLYLFTMQEGQAYSRTALYLTGVIYAILTYIVRIIWKKILRSRMSEGNRSLLVVTTKDMAEQVVHNIRENNYERFTLSGLVIIDDDLCGTKIAGVPVVANEENAAAYVCREWIDEVFVIPATDVPYPYALMEQFTEAGVTVHLNLAKVSEAMGGKKQLVEKVGPYTVLTTSINYASTKQLFMKRAIDIAGGLFGCLLTLLITLFVGPAIYLKSPGPIFFAQERVGKNGKKFKMYKFRSMYMDAEERKAELMKQNRVSDGMMFKLDFDPRVIGNEILPDGTKKTGIGNFIRVTSLDEFPQFFNVLKGDMSIVGTRPPTLDEWNKYELHHRARLICPYDPFGDDRMIYTIRNHCVENPELPYEDGARTIFLYTKGRKGRDNESLSQLLDYMENTTRENAVSEELEAIQEMVDVVKEDAEVTVAYMKGFERDQMFLEEGKELGRRLEQENTLREKNRADTEKNRADTEKNRADTEKNRADTEKNRADTEKNRADAEKHRAEEERQRADAAVEEIEKLRRQLEELQKQ